MTTAATIRISTEDLEDFVEAQKAHPILGKLRELLEADLSQCGMQVSPQGILHKVVDDEQLMMVPHDLRQKILAENHHVPTLGYVRFNLIMDLIKRAHWWHGLSGDVAAYVWDYPICQ